MALGRLFHYTVDAVLVSTVLAGIRQSERICNPNERHIKNPTLRSLAERYSVLARRFSIWHKHPRLTASTSERRQD
ncbi:hypothetical protein EDD15DRAFT_2300190, partial [Pisolithus albus]